MRDALRKTTKDRLQLSFIDSVGFETRPLNEALGRLERLLGFHKGALVLSAAWGLGAIANLDYFYRRITVDFRNRKGHHLTFDAACETLLPAPENHILVINRADPDRVAKMLKDEPGEFVKAVLSSFGDMPVTRLEELCAQHGFIKAGAAWKAFWSPERTSAARKTLDDAARRHQLDPRLFAPFFALVEADYEPGSLFEAGVIPPEMLSNYIEAQPGGRKMIFTSVSFDPNDTDAVTEGLIDGPQTLVLEPFYYCRDLVEIIHDDFNTTLWISSLFVLIVLLIAFRNVWVALIAFFPMFLSWYVLQGLMTLFGLEFNMINIVISTFVFGIGVDYSIFVMEGLLQEARTGETARLEYHKVAIFFSALILIIVVGSLIFASHPANSATGRITLIGMLSPILMTYSLEPFVFRKLLKTGWFRRSLILDRK